MGKDNKPKNSQIHSLIIGIILLLTQIYSLLQIGYQDCMNKGGGKLQVQAKELVLEQEREGEEELGKA